MNHNLNETLGDNLPTEELASKLLSSLNSDISGDRYTVLNQDEYAPLAELNPLSNVSATKITSETNNSSFEPKPSYGIQQEKLNGYIYLLDEDNQPERDSLLLQEDVEIETAAEEISIQLDPGENPAFDLIGLTQLRNDPQFAGIDGSGFSVAVIDTGINYNHPSIAPRYITGYDFVNRDSDPIDDQGHGTHVAGTVGAADETIGVAPDAGLIGLKVLGADGSGSFNYMYQALQWVLDNHEQHNIVAINMSLGAGFYGSEQESAADFGIGIDLVNRLEEQGIVVVSAAGNSYEENQTLNTGAPGIFSTLNVGAVWQDDVTDSYTRTYKQTPGSDRVVYFSQRIGADNFIVAPGAEITSASINGGLEDLRGTSMASPHVAGAVAVLQEAASQFSGRQLTADEVVDILKSTADLVTDGDDENDVVANSGLSFPRMNIYNAVAEVKRRADGIAPPPPPPENPPENPDDPPEDPNPPTAGDPNGTIAGAFIGPILDGEPVQPVVGSIGSDGGSTQVGDKDVDIIQFRLESPGLVTLELGTRADNPDDFDTYLRLFAEDGTEIAFNDDINPGIQQFSRLEAQLEPGTYYAGVSGFDNGSYDPNVAGSGVSADTGNYSLSFDLDNSDPNGLISGAVDVLLGNDLEPLIFPGFIGADYGEPVGVSDVDLFRVVVPDDGTLFIDIDTPYNEGEYVDSFVRLFDENGEELFFADSGEPFESDDDLGFDVRGNPTEFLLENEIVVEDPNQTTLNNGFFDEEGNYTKGNYGHRTDSFLGVLVDRGDVYYVGVSDFFNQDYDATNLDNRPEIGEGGSYELIATFANNDINGTISQINTTTALPLLSSQEKIGEDDGVAVGDRDVDFWQFSSDTAGILDIDIDSEEVDSYALLFDSEGRLLADNDDTDDVDPSLQYRIEANQNYFVAITGFGNQNFDPFALGSGSGGATGTYSINAKILNPNLFSTLSDNSLNSELVRDANLDRIIAGNVGEDNGFTIGSEDIDLYRFTAEKDTKIEIEVDASEEFNANTFLRFFDSSGNEIAFNDNATELNKGSVLQQDVKANTEYIIGINGSTENARNYNPVTGEGAASAPVSALGDYTLTITEIDGTETNLPTVAINDVSLAEGSQSNIEFSFTVSLNEAAEQAVTVDYEVDDDTATAGDDYIDSSGTLTFEPGETTKTIAVTVLADDVAEETESFAVRLSNLSDNAELRDGRGVGTIIDNDNSDPSDTIELFRFRNVTYSTGTYVFVGAEERDFILNDPNLSQTFTLDGQQANGDINPAFKASKIDGEGLIPFYRLASLDNLGTFLFVSTAEYDAIFAEESNQKDKWDKQGFDQNNNDIPEFYLLDSSADSGTQFSRFQNTQNGTFLYAGSAEADAIEDDPNLANLFNNQGDAFKSLP